MSISTFLKDFRADAVLVKNTYRKNFSSIRKYVDLEHEFDYNPYNASSDNSLGGGGTSGGSSAFSYDEAESTKTTPVFLKYVLEAVGGLVNNIKAFVFPLNRLFLKFSVDAPEDEVLASEKKYSDLVSRAIFKKFVNSNFHSIVDPALKDCVNYGCGCLVMDQYGSDYVFRYVPHYSLFFLQDSKNSFYRVGYTLNYTYTQLKDYIINNKLPMPISEKFKSGSRFECTFFSVRRDDVTKTMFKGRKKYYTGIFIPELDDYVGEDLRGTSGLNIFPFRFFLGDNPWGIGIGFKSAGHCKIMNDVVLDIFNAQQNILNPTHLVSDPALLEQLDNNGQLPAQAFILSEDPRGNQIQTLADGANGLPSGWDTVIRFNEELKAMYYNQQLNNTKNAEQSATEIYDIRAQRNRALGPSTMQIFEDLVKPICERIYNTMSKSELPKAPDTLNGKSLIVNIVSQLHDSASQQELSDLQLFLGGIAKTAIEAEPKTRFRINWDAMLTGGLTNFGLSHYINTEKDYNDAVDKFDENQRKAEQEVLRNNEAGRLKTVSEVEKNSSGS